LHDIKKSIHSFQPIYEAFTNALESIKIKKHTDPDFDVHIIIDLNAVETTYQYTEFNSLRITDTEQFKGDSFQISSQILKSNTVIPKITNLTFFHFGIAIG
jgi:hypothetical protein